MLVFLELILFPWRTLGWLLTPRVPSPSLGYRRLKPQDQSWSTTLVVTNCFLDQSLLPTATVAISLATSLVSSGMAVPCKYTHMYTYMYMYTWIHTLYTIHDQKLEHIHVFIFMLLVWIEWQTFWELCLLKCYRFLAGLYSWSSSVPYIRLTCSNFSLSAAYLVRWKELMVSIWSYSWRDQEKPPTVDMQMEEKFSDQALGSSCVQR